MTSTRVTWRNGAKVSNGERLLMRATAHAILREAPERVLPPTHPDGVGMAQSHPKKGWARRYLRARGLPL